MENPKSTFVTLVAWIFIVLSGFATLISVLQNIMVALMFQPEEFQQATDNVPAGAKFMFVSFQWFVLLFFVLSV